MFFIFSKLLVGFIYPFTWILLCLLAAIVIKRAKLKRFFLIGAFTLSLIFSCPFLLDRFAKQWDIRSAPLNSSKPYSCAIVLGGFAGGDANGGGYFNAHADRFIKAVQLFNSGRVSYILVSGGNGGILPGQFKEADWVKAQLRQFNVPDSCILTENQSRNTIENAAFSKVILNSRHLQPPYILITSAFHMRRSLGIFNNAKLSVMPYSCDYIAGNEKIIIDSFIPNGDILSRWDYYTKEVVGTLVNRFR